MIRLFVPRRRLLLLGLGLLFVLGCASSPPTRFYTLSSLQEGGKELRDFSPGQDLVIGVGPIKFPEYLDRAEIVTRSGSNKITVSDFDLWAGSLAEDFNQVLTENLSVLLSAESVIVYPRLRPGLAKYQITMDVIRFDGSLGGDVSLIVRWAILEGKERKVVFLRKSAIIEPSGEKGYEAMVAANSRALEKLSREIADAVKKLAKSG
jgi:uncharacterized lipoprotein YmbA